MALSVSPRNRYEIPDDLVEAVSERRAIPFIGAGFSSTLGLPNWRDLLAGLCSEIDTEYSFEEIAEYASEDFLQIAEYLFIKSDRRIGPLRHFIEQGILENKTSPVLSAAHVELVNLGAPQIYTTNYDALIETTYKQLGLDCAVVALPKDVASINDHRAQVIKYHGDLRHESTLVLTESAYYKRLDFESPMDLKFRSDLLGRSVLYMGYSFRDVNIRLIWFKLMQMMQDIPESDRRPSFIVRLTPNPVLDELYRDVGLRTIVLDPKNSYRKEDQANLLGDFLADLASRASVGHHIPGSDSPLYVSSHLIEKARESLESRGENPFTFRHSLRLNQFDEPKTPSFHRALTYRQVPEQLADLAKPVFHEALSDTFALPLRSVRSFANKVSQFGAHPNVTNYFCVVLSGGRRDFHSMRRFITSPSANMPWEVIWGGALTLEHVKALTVRAATEIAWNEEGRADTDLIYMADVLRRIQLGMIYSGPSEESEKVAEIVGGLLDRISTIYPDVSSYEPSTDSAPQVAGLLHQVEKRRRTLPKREDSGGPSLAEWMSMQRLWGDL